MRTSPIVISAAVALLLAGCSEPAGTGAANAPSPAPTAQPAPADAANTGTAATPKPAAAAPQRLPLEALQKTLRPSTTCNLEYLGDTLLGAEAVQAGTRSLTFKGWLGNEAGAVEQPALRFETADDKSAVWAVPITLGEKRDDVVASTGKAAFANAGFNVEVDASTLPPGRYHLYLAHESGDAVDVCDNGRYVELAAASP